MAIAKQVNSKEDQPKKAPGTGFRGGNENINRSGRRPAGVSKPTNRDLRERELLKIGRAHV